MVGGSCTREGGAEEVAYGVSSLLRNFLAGAETIANRLRRGEREENSAERETMSFYTRRSVQDWKRGGNMR